MRGKEGRKDGGDGQQVAGAGDGAGFHGYLEKGCQSLEERQQTLRQKAEEKRKSKGVSSLLSGSEAVCCLPSCWITAG
jgi:hypothetical protein